MAALSALGVALEKPVFPAVVACPFCQKSGLYLFDDLTTDGIWLHCSECAARGDIITFGARIWNTSRIDALVRFVELGVAGKHETDRLSGEYIRAWSRIEAAEAFWETSAGQLWNHNDDVVAVRLRELGLDSSIEAGRELVGVAHPDQVAEFCRAMGRPTPARMREHGPSLVLPLYDLPGRMTGVLLVQYDDRFMTRRTFIPISGRRRRTEAGYYMLSTVLLPPCAALRNSYFVTDDPFWVMKAQATQLKSGQGLLPIAASYSGPEAVSTGLNWQAFAPTPRMFHAASYTPDVISQACTAKGYVCVLPNPAVERPSSPVRTLHRLAFVRRQAITWQNALKDTLTGMSETAAQAFVSKLTLDIDKLRRFFQANQRWLSTDLSARLLARVEAGPSLPNKVMPKKVIIERDGGWWTTTGTQICNAQIRVNKIVHADDGSRMYVGIIRLDGRELSFADSAEKIERVGLLAYAAQLAAAEGVFMSFDRSWNARAYLAVCQIHEPEIVHVSGKIGWSEQSHEFCFYGYSLANDGTVKQSPYPEINRERRGDFPEPTPVAPLSIRHLLTPSHENALVWTAFATVTAQLVGPILGKQPTPVACAPKVFSFVQQIGQTLGCPHTKLSLVARYDGAKHINKYAAEADWPAFVSHLFNDTNLAAAVPRVVSAPVIVRMPELAALLAAGYGWQVLRGTVPEGPQDFSALRYVLPSYLQRLLERRMTPILGGSNLVAAILTDLEGWLKDIYSTTFNLPCALSRLAAGDKAHELFMAAVDLALSTGKLDILPRPRRKDQAKNFLLRNKTYWWLNQRAIERYCIATGGGTIPNWSALAEQLEQAGVLRGENTVHNMPGLLVDREWADRFWSDYTTPDQQELG